MCLSFYWKSWHLTYTSLSDFLQGEYWFFSCNLVILRVVLIIVILLIIFYLSSDFLRPSWAHNNNRQGNRSLPDSLIHFRLLNLHFIFIILSIEFICIDIIFLAGYKDLLIDSVSVINYWIFLSWFGWRLLSIE